MSLRAILFLVALSIGFANSSTAQIINAIDTAGAEGQYPYVLPIWAQKAYDRGYGDQLQLPFGANLNYVNAFIGMNIVDFELLVGDQDLSGIINTETLNFQEVSATTNGANFRLDAWILPFINVYGMYSQVTGGTNVTLQPTWRDELGEIILQLPQFSSEVEFDAKAYGFGTTMVFGFDGYFLNTDVNYSATQTELLKEDVGYLALSARVGYRFMLSKKKTDRSLALYGGMMYRNFVGAKGSSGSINFDEIFPGMDESFNGRVDTKVAENEALIADLNPITDRPEIIRLEVQNAALRSIQGRVNDSGVFTTEINYFIEKQMIQSVTFQFGFNFQINKHWMLRGEYGIAESQRFLMSGLQYRFGF